MQTRIGSKRIIDPEYIWDSMEMESKIGWPKEFQFLMK